MKNKFGKTISTLRRQNGWSQKETALKLGISQALLSHYEKGIRECGLDFLIKASKVFNCSTDYLLGISDLQNTAENDTDSISADLKALPKFEKSRTDAVNTLNLLYSITVRLGNPEICKDFNKIVNSDIYSLLRAFETRFFDNENFKTNQREAVINANRIKYNAFSGIFNRFESENINLNLTSEILLKEYPICSKSFSNIINSIE